MSDILDRPRAVVALVVALIAALVATATIAVMVTTASQAAFSATTSNGSNSWDTGSVAIADDDSGTAMFAVTNLTAGQSVSKCIKVTYTGTIVPATVKMYGTAAGGLAQYLDTTIEVGSGGTFANCAGFTPSSTVFTGTLDSFGTTKTDFATGVSVFAPAAQNDAVTVRITTQVQNTMSAMGANATASFTWEAQG